MLAKIGIAIAIVFLLGGNRGELEAQPPEKLLKESQVGELQGQKKQRRKEWVYSRGGEVPCLYTRSLHVSSIFLNSDEQVEDIRIGDSQRWSIEVSKYRGRVILVVKPLVEEYIETNIFIYTDKRFYEVVLKANEELFTSQLVFRYEEEGGIKGFIRGGKERGEAKESEMGKVIKYEVISKLKEGRDKDIYPKAVYSQGGRTVIEFSEKMKYSQLPYLEVYSANKNVIANYRFVNNSYIIDGIYDKLELYRSVDRRSGRVIMKIKS